MSMCKHVECTQLCFCSSLLTSHYIFDDGESLTTTAAGFAPKSGASGGGYKNYVCNERAKRSYKFFAVVEVFVGSFLNAFSSVRAVKQCFTIEVLRINKPFDEALITHTQVSD